MRKWVLNLIFKFHNDSMVNESEIIVLMGQVWMYAGRASCEGHCSHHRHYLKIPTMGMWENEFGTWCSNFMIIQWLTSIGS